MVCLEFVHAEVIKKLAKGRNRGNGTGSKLEVWLVTKIKVQGTAILLEPFQSSTAKQANGTDWPSDRSER